MKKTGHICFLTLLVILLAGCGPADSLNPLYTEKDVIFDPSLLGVWMANDGGIGFEKVDDTSNRYRIVSLDSAGKRDSKSDRYEGTLVNLGGHRFLDVVQEQLPDVSVTNEFHIVLSKSKSGSKAGYGVDPLLFYLGNNSYADFVPNNSDASGTSFKFRVRSAHWFLTVQSTDKTLRFGLLDDDWTKKALQKGNIHIAHAFVGPDHKQLVLTANTDELQRFVREHEEDKDAFSPTDEMHRVN